MTNSHPPRVALWLLERFAVDNEPLIGDLVEQFEARSRWWFWRQVIAAVVIARFRRPHEIRPLRLVDRKPGESTAPPVFERRTINLTSSPIHGVGGLGLVTLALLISVVAPGLWWVALVVVLNGILLGASLILIRQLRAR